MTHVTAGTESEDSAALLASPLTRAAQKRGMPPPIATTDVERVSWLFYMIRGQVMRGL